MNRECNLIRVLTFIRIQRRRLDDWTSPRSLRRVSIVYPLLLCCGGISSSAALRPYPTTPPSPPWSADHM